MMNFEWSSGCRSFCSYYATFVVGKNIEPPGQSLAQEVTTLDFRIPEHGSQVNDRNPLSMTLGRHDTIWEQMGKWLEL